MAAGAGTLANRGTIDVTGTGGPQLAYSAVLDNQTGATLNFQADGIITNYYTGGSLSNEGTITMTATGTATLSGMTFTNSGTINVASGTLAIAASGGTSTGTTFTVAAGGNVNISGGTFINTTFTLAAGGNVAISGGTFTGTFSVAAGGNVAISGGTFTGTTFNVAQGATVDLGGSTISGALTGSGAGTVNITDSLAAGLGGATLDFPGTMLQWTGGFFSLADGDVTNLGTINLAGGNDVGIGNDGTFDNFGTIIQTGSGSLALHSDNVTATTLMIEPGASYLIESDSGINNDYGGVVALVNEGTIKKTAGSGTSQLYVNGALSNGGTIEADSGTLYVNANSIAQVSGGTLAGGTWNAMQGATLQFPTGAAITANAASLTISGAGGSMTGIAGLASNSGTLTVSAGAGFTTAGDLANSGSLTAGAGSTITVSGNFMQTSDGTLDDQIGGAPASGQFGQVAVAKTATLAGAFGLSLAGGFAPSAGQEFAVMTFASAAGSFTGFNGFRGLFTESLGSTALDLTAPSAAVNLATGNVTAPTSATSGQQITVDWKVTDQSSQAASGSWQDSVYLSPTPAIGSGSHLLGSVEHSGGLAAGTSYNGSLTAALPAVGPGNYYLLVEADSLMQAPDTNRANNILAAGTGQLQVSVPALTLGTAHNDTFSAANQDHYYQVAVPSGGSLVVSLASAASSGSTALYVSQGVLPTAYNFDEEADVANQPSQTLTVPKVAAATTYYILAHSVSGTAATAGFTVTAKQTAAVTVSAIGPTSGGNGGNVTVEIDGTNFAANDTVGLTLGSTTIYSSSIDFVSASQMYATFNLSAAASGSYTLSVQSVNAPTHLPGRGGQQPAAGDLARGALGRSLRPHLRDHRQLHESVEQRHGRAAAWRRVFQRQRLFQHPGRSERLPVERPGAGDGRQRPGRHPPARPDRTVHRHALVGGHR